MFDVNKEPVSDSEKLEQMQFDISLLLHGMEGDFRRLFELMDEFQAFCIKHGLSK